MKVKKKEKLVLGYSPWGYRGETDCAPFDKLFAKQQDLLTAGFKDKETNQHIDAVMLFGGGEDVHPSYYKQKAHPRSHVSAKPSARDVFEWKTILYCKAYDIPIIGICLGAQRLCAAAGGTLVQDVDGHGISHDIEFVNGDRCLATSIHHQMMNPFNVEHQLIAWSRKRQSAYYQGEAVDQHVEMEREPEIVYFPQVQGFAIQGHPEYSNATTMFRRKCVKEMADFLNFADYYDESKII